VIILTITRTISATEFKAKCLDLIDRLGTGEFDRIVITKRGKPVASLQAPRVDSRAVLSLYGCMRGSVVLPAGLDLTLPILDRLRTPETETLND
jgi:prevent-host-death family protein